MSDSGRPFPGQCEHFLDRHRCNACERVRLEAELAEARQEIERMKAELAALAPADY